MKDKLIRIIASKLSRKQTLQLQRVVFAAKSFIKYRDIHFPQLIFLEIQTRCNRGCSYCPEHLKLGPTADMSWETFELALKRMQELKWSGPVAYHYTNEPLKDSRLEDMIMRTRIALPKASPILFTNGDYLTEARAKSLIDAGLVRATITRHAPYSTKWDERIESIINKFPGVFRLFKIGNESLINVGGTAENYTGNKVFTYCDSITLTLPIRYDGNVSPCCCDYDRSASIGNIYEHSILTIVKNFKKKQDALRKGIKQFKICKGCSGVRKTNVD